MMFSQLHARRKHTAVHETEGDAEAATAGLSTSLVLGVSGSHNNNGNNKGNNNMSAGGGGDADKQRRHSARKRPLPREIQWAFSSVTLFLAFGLLMGYFLVHHRHRKVIYHVLRDPVGHGKGVFLHGRVGFRHHFYTGPPRFVTVVMPSVVKPDGRTQRLNAIQDTWGPAARAIFVAHNVSEFPQAAHAVLSETKNPQDPYAFPQLLILPDHIRQEEGLPRLYYTIRTVFEKVNPDFAMFVNDHTHVLSPHLCKYLEDKNPSHDLYAGRALAGDNQPMFNSGAAGYVLSRETMRKLVQKWNQQDETCWLGPDAKKWLQNNPGLVNAKCLASMNVHAVDTRAAHKWHRFHAFPLMRVVAGTVDEWYRKKHKNVADQHQPSFDASYETLLTGPDCCSSDTISFHYVEWKESLALFAVREELLKNPHLSDHELKSIMLTEWPRNSKDIGFYSQGLPKDSDEEAWKDLLATMRKISMRKTQRDC